MLQKFCDQVIIQNSSSFFSSFFFSSTNVRFSNSSWFLSDPSQRSLDFRFWLYSPNKKNFTFSRFLKCHRAQNLTLNWQQKPKHVKIVVIALQTEIFFELSKYTLVTFNTHRQHTSTWKRTCSCAARWQFFVFNRFFIRYLTR